MFHYLKNWELDVNKEFTKYVPFNWSITFLQQKKHLWFYVSILKIRRNCLCESFSYTKYLIEAESN